MNNSLLFELVIFTKFDELVGESMKEQGRMEIAFLQDVLVLHGLSKNLSKILFLLLISHPDPNQPLILNGYVKKELASVSQFTVGSIDNALVKFNGVGLLTRLDRGTYQINPLLHEFYRIKKSGEGDLRLTYMGEERKILGRETKGKER